MPFDGRKFQETKPEVFSLEGLIAWLETKPAGETYCWAKNGECLFAQWGEAFSDKRGFGAYVWAYEHFAHHLGEPDEVEPTDIAVGRPRTFGAALARARKLQAERG